MISLIGLLILLGILAFVVKIVLPRLAKGQVGLHHQKDPVLFTPAERSFLGVLEQALGDQFRRKEGTLVLKQLEIGWPFLKKREVWRA